MADIRAIARTTGKGYNANGQLTDLTSTRDGALYTADYILNKAMEGRLFTVQLGVQSTPVTFRVALDADQPEMVVDVPSGVTIIPVSIDVVLEDAGGTDNEVVALANPALCGAATSTAGVILNNRLNSGLASACRYSYTYAGDCTAPANFVEFFRFNHAFVDEGDIIVGNAIQWRASEAAPVVLVGPASLVIYIDGTGTAPAGYAKASFIEFASSEV